MAVFRGLGKVYRARDPKLAMFEASVPRALFDITGSAVGLIGPYARSARLSPRQTAESFSWRSSRPRKSRTR